MQFLRVPVLIYLNSRQAPPLLYQIDKKSETILESKTVLDVQPLNPVNEKPFKSEIETTEEEEMVVGFDENELIIEENVPEDDQDQDQMEEYVDYEEIIVQHCGVPFINEPPSTSFNRSMKITIEKQVECEICLEQFSSNEKLAEHLNEDHPNQELHKCNYCLLAFSTIDLAQRHMKKHQIQALKKEKDHTNGKTNKCHLCPEIFKYNKDLLVHLKAAHADEDITIYQCYHCSKTFSSEKKLEKHIYMSHSGRQNTFICGHCGRTFSKKQTLLEHENTHMGIVNYKCELCAKDFIYKSSYERHKLYHSDDRKFVCDLCPKSYKTFGHLTIHKRIHTGERPFACPICDHRFMDSSSMIKHRQRVHNVK